MWSEGNTIGFYLKEITQVTLISLLLKLEAQSRFTSDYIFPVISPTVSHLAHSWNGRNIFQLLLC